METVLLVAVAVLLVPNLIVTGLHDVPNAIAIPTRTRALSPRAATRLAAGANAAGVVMTYPLGNQLFSWFAFPSMQAPLVLLVIAAALISLLTWNITTYLRGVPTSTTHGLLAGLIGGALATMLLQGADSTEVLALPWHSPVLNLLVTPLVAFGGAYLLVFLAVRAAQGRDPDAVHGTSRAAQAVCAGLTSFGTGLQQGQRYIFVLLLGSQSAGLDLQPWLLPILLVFALLLALGCLQGGWRIGHMLGHRLVTMDPLRGMVSTTTTSALLFIGSLMLSLPLSTSMTAASSVIGAGSNQRFATVNWPQGIRLFGYWAATPAVTALVAALLVLAGSPLLALA